MTKYVLAICTMFFHTFVNNSKVILESKDNQQLSDKKNELVLNHNTESDSTKNVQDSTIYIKKNGVHSATWYNPHGAKTASGLRFHKDSLTAAYNFSKMHSYLKVTNVNNNQFVIVRVTDRMGYKGSNHIDLSKCAFDSIGNPNSGRIKVIVEEIINN